MNKRRGAFRKSALSLGVLSLVVYAGAPGAREVNGEAELRSTIAAANLQDAIVVDCQLPGNLQKLGGMRTYMTPGKLVRLAAVDCRTRGGEYTVGDLSGGTLSLQRWMPLAEKGDAEAQYYVARIYANGMGGAPTDYSQAASWYKRAADQNYSSALQELGYMYERGLGVERDPKLALNLQRKASGLGEELDYASKVTEAQGQVAALTDQLEASNAELQGLRDQLATTTDSLLKSRAQVAKSENAVYGLKEKLKAAQAAAGTDPAELKQMQANLAQSEKALTDARGQVEQLTIKAREQEATLKTQLSASQASSSELNELLSNEQEKNRSLTARVTQAEQRFLRSQQELTTARTQYRAEVQQLAQQRDAIELATTKTKSADAAVIAARERDLELQLERQQQRVAVLEKALAEALRGQANAKTAKSESDLRKDLTAQQKQLEAQRSELTALRAKAQQDQAGLARQMNEQMERQATDLGAKERRVAALTAETAALRSEVARLEQQRKQDQVADASDAAKARETLRLAQAKYSETTEKLEAEQTNRAKEVAELTAARGKLERELSNSKKANEMQVTFLRKDLELRTREIATKDTVIASLEKQVSEQKTMIAGLDAQARRSNLLASNTGAATPTKLRSVSAPRIDLASLGVKPSKYRALVIGNAQYNTKVQSLTTPTEDAKDVADLLKTKYGFDVKLMRNATAAEIILALDEETTKGTADDSLLIYYAGHGDDDAVPNRTFWLGVDADPNTRTVGYIESESIRGKIKQMKAKHVLLVVDSCFSGNITSPKTTTVGRGLTETRVKVQWNRRARMVLTSGSDTPVADGITNDPSHSPFARNFLQVLRQNDGLLSGEMLSYELKGSMEAEAIPVDKEGRKQTPTYSVLQDANHDVGDFFFVPVATPARALAGLTD